MAAELPENSLAKADPPPAQSASPASAPSAAPASPPVADVSSAPAATIEAPKVEVAVDPTSTPTLLARHDAAKAEAAKPAEKPVEPAKADDKAQESKKDAAKPVEAATAEAAKPAEPTKPEPVEYKYTVPDSIKLDDALKGKVHSVFDEFRANPAEGAQKLIDLHNEQMTAYASRVRRDQIETFNKTKETWDKAWLADPEIGGAGHETALGAIARTRDLGISSAKYGSPRYQADLAEFQQFLEVTGAGSHPAFGRLLHNLARFVDEPQAKDIPADIKPPKSNGKAPKSGIYTHPSSANMDK